MAKVTFYEKPGCINNTKQKALLKALGHTVVARNLLAELWTGERLRPFFSDLPVRTWLNPSAPRIKSGEIDPCQVTETQALTLMCADPLLIRRPLMQVDQLRMAGFDDCALLRDLGVRQAPETDLQTCPHGHAVVEVEHG